MTTIVEKDSSAPAILLTVVFLIVVTASGLDFAFVKGAFGKKSTVIENNMTVENKSIVLPAQPSSPVPASTPDSEKPAQTPAH